MPKFGTIEVYEELARQLNGDHQWCEVGKGVTSTLAFHYETPVDKTFVAKFAAGRVEDVHELIPGEGIDTTLSADPVVWRNIHEGKTSPMMAITRRKLKVDGDFAGLMRHMKAFGLVMDAMTTIELV